MMKSKQTKDNLKHVDATAHLLSSEVNKKRLEAAIKEMDSNIYQKHRLNTGAIDKK